MLWFHEKKLFLNGYELRLTVSSLNVEPPECTLPGLTYTNNSFKKRKSCDDFPASMKYDMDGPLRMLADPSIMSDKFSEFGEMICEELK